MNLFAINQIDRGTKANPRIIPPAHVIDLDRDKVVDELLKIDAVREATSDEVKIAKALGKFLVDAPAVAKVEEPAKEPSSDRAALEVRATAVGVEFSGRIGDAKLLERVEEAEKKAVEGSNPTTLV